jgi:hypothetical protein
VSGTISMGAGPSALTAAPSIRQSARMNVVTTLVQLDGQQRQ